MKEHILTTNKKPKHYVRNADLLPAVIESQEKGQMTDDLVRMLQLMVTNYASKGNFASYTYLSEMKSTATVNLCHAWSKFNPERSNNPFAYFTQCIKTSFFQILNAEKKQQEIRDKELVFAGLNPSNTYLVKHEEEQRQSREGDDNDESDDIDS